MKPRKIIVVLNCILVAFAMTPSAAVAQDEKPSTPAAGPNRIAAAKLIVNDLKAAEAFYKGLFAMKEVTRYNTDVYEETILGLDEGAHLALFAPKQEAPLKKSQYPVVLIYTGDFDALLKRTVEAGYEAPRLLERPANERRIAIARDPAGNAVEILERAGQGTAVAGSKIIVEDLEKAEQFFTHVLGIEVMRRLESDVYKEVIYNLGENTYLALFAPKAEAALPKSRFPVVAFYCDDFDGVAKRIEKEGLATRDVATTTPGRRILIAQDPSNNAIEFLNK